MVYTRLPALLAILCIAASLRFYGLNWDQGHNLHPDERFLLMVANDSAVPAGIADYLNPAVSPLNPYNTKYHFFVYGTFPTTLNKLIVTALGADGFDALRTAGRTLSALADLGILLSLFFFALMLERLYRFDSRVKYSAALLYAFTVFPIQQAHFFTVDSFQVLGCMLALDFALLAYISHRIWPVAASAAAFGLAVGCKISAVYVLPLLLALGLLRHPFSMRWGYLRIAMLPAIVRLLLFAAVSYLALRFADPKFFADGSLLNPRMNPQFLANIRELQGLTSYADWPFPPSVQWLSKTPILFPLMNIAVFGLGLPYALLSACGALAVFRARRLELSVFVLWAIGIFLFQGSGFVHSMRYFYLLYPLFALLAALGLERAISWFGGRDARAMIAAVVAAAVLLWPAAFMKIYSRPHSRVTASEWIYDHVPSGSVIAGEHWDDALPLSMPGKPQSYSIKQLPVFAPDNEEKWREMDEVVSSADYIIFSSNRGYGSILPSGHKVPRTANWYRDLFDGRTAFRKVAEFTSLPTLEWGAWKLEVDTQQAEEAFSVYDHPKVTIFERVARSAIQPAPVGSGETGSPENTWTR